MIEEQMYNKIKSFQVMKFSVRDTAKRLNISPTTVQKFRKMSFSEYKELTNNTFRRKSVLDPYRELLLNWLLEYPKIRKTRLYRKLHKLHPEITISVRAFSNYICKLKATMPPSSSRYFTPVDYIPGAQIQVDPGEQKVLLITGEQVKVYFVAFKLSYSRMGYAHFQLHPYNTKNFIKAHESCFKYFGYLPLQLAYDQTKLVVIREKYREVWLNQEFEQYLNKNKLSTFICEGYDPQSKGLIERHVREVKEDFLYGTKFADISEVILRSKDWFEETNNRIHSTTLKRPIDVFQEEKNIMRPYIFDNRKERKVDKQGLISWKGNKYSIPYIYQNKSVVVEEFEDTLFISDIDTLQHIAKHTVEIDKAIPTIDKGHYIDYSKKLEELKKEALELLKDYQNHDIFIQRILDENTTNLRAQLRAIRHLYKKYICLDWNIVIGIALTLNLLRASKVEEILESLTRKAKLLNYSENIQEQHKLKKSKLTRELSIYDKMVKK